ncbi:hypothetical protein KO491_03065 [Roseovarius nubinhibens]|nr:hypothetical protein [Roseovarius nubinhibens]
MTLMKRLCLTLYVLLLRQCGLRALRRGDYGRARQLTDRIRRLESKKQR